jgi:hypothetical protein
MTEFRQCHTITNQILAKMNHLRVPPKRYDVSYYSYNCGIGCSHNCRYCYSADFFVQERIISNRTEWAVEIPNSRKINIHLQVDKAIQFPSAHDITPDYLDTYCQTLTNILEAGNRVLLVSKPHVDCIGHICREFQEYRGQMEMRFTIGSLNPELTSYWEPGAPLPEERMRALAHATEQGFQTSVSMEPMLAGREDAIATFTGLLPLTNGTIWIGMMNGLDKRMVISTEEDQARYDEIARLQSREEMIALYQDLVAEPQVRWKDSIKDLVRYL